MGDCRLGFCSEGAVPTSVECVRSYGAFPPEIELIEK